MKRIKRAVKAGDPNPNTGLPINGLETELRKYFDEFGKYGGICVDDVDISIRYGGRDNHDVMYTTDFSRCFGIVKDFNEEYFFVDLTGYGEMLFEGHMDGDVITGYVMGVVSVVDSNDMSTCERVIRLNLFKDNTEKENTNG